ncbi:hypothetical protein M0D45_10355 [Xanthomonas prunicola]|uniref:hypothetical protein n=1 Tax=Xanthomonas prunicola TaxID=2053930 RepID=UPI0021B2BC4F|nr:hypothetical protein [Xanthomonas prunicola]UXA55051.1 hypothetical protein M0D45_10355 [Xanthomonas prunicola]
MLCFNHENTQAIGLCKHCSKALCHSCANDLGFGLACRDLHEEEVISTTQAIVRSIRAQSIGGPGRYATAIFYIVLGVLFGGYEVLFRQNLGFGAVLGGLFVAYGLYAAIAIRHAFRIKR